MNTYTVRLYVSAYSGGVSTAHDITSLEPVYVKAEDGNFISFTDENHGLIAVFDRAAVVSITLKQEPVQA